MRHPLPLPRSSRSACPCAPQACALVHLFRTEPARRIHTAARSSPLCMKSRRISRHSPALLTPHRSEPSDFDARSRKSNVIRPAAATAPTTILLNMPRSRSRYVSVCYRNWRVVSSGQSTPPTRQVGSTSSDVPSRVWPMRRLRNGTRLCSRARGTSRRGGRLRRARAAWPRRGRHGPGRRGRNRCRR